MMTDDRAMATAGRSPDHLGRVMLGVIQKLMNLVSSNSGRGCAMRATITIDDRLVAELLQFAGTSNRTAAIVAAVEAYVRRAKIEGLMALAGRVDILSNEEIEAADMAQAEAWSLADREALVGDA
jgi:Arc/MetJ family transcription regulator